MAPQRSGRGASLLDGKGQRAYWDKIRAARQREAAQRARSDTPLTADGADWVRTLRRQRYGST